MKISMKHGPEELAVMANNIRLACIKFGPLSGSFGAHYGPALSLVEIMTVIMGASNLALPGSPDFPTRDRIILSKGHGSLALYTALHEFGFVSDEVMNTCEQDGSMIPGQPKRNHDLGIEFSSGSLGMGLGFGVGLALAANLKYDPQTVFVIMGDGETNEGSVWESAMAAAQFGLHNIVAVVDANDLQSDGTTHEVMYMDHLRLWSAIGWDVEEVDGHSIESLIAAVTKERSQPLAIIARTVKGKGVSFMENSVDWHHGILDAEQLNIAIDEISGGNAP